MKYCFKKLMVLSFIALSLFVLTLFGCGKVHYGLSSGTYTLQVEEGTTDVMLFARPQITFDAKDRTFTARISIASSYFAAGKYEIDNGYVTAKTDDGLYTYVFEIVDNDYIKFVQEKSTECGFADGALFKFRGSNAVELGEAFTGEVNTFEGMSMEVVQGTVYEDGATIEIVNASGEEIYGGNQNDYHLQVYVDGVWYELEGQAFPNTDEALLYDGTTTQGLNWLSRYGSLPAGSYRVVKVFSPRPGKSFVLAAEFSILESMEGMQQRDEE